MARPRRHVAGRRHAGGRSDACGTSSGSGARAGRGFLCGRERRCAARDIAGNGSNEGDERSEDEFGTRRRGTLAQVGQVALVTRVADGAGRPPGPGRRLRVLFASRQPSAARHACADRRCAVCLGRTRRTGCAHAFGQHPTRLHAACARAPCRFLIPRSVRCHTACGEGVASIRANACPSVVSGACPRRCLPWRQETESSQYADPLHTDASDP